MVVGFESLPENMQSNVKALALQTIRQIDLTHTNESIELAVTGTDKRGFGYLKILRFFKEND